jgi:hypothetical protein
LDVSSDNICYTNLFARYTNVTDHDSSYPVYF